MDLFYFYNGVKNIINLSLENELYISNSTLIYNDPLVILDFENYFQKGGEKTPLEEKKQADKYRQGEEKKRQQIETKNREQREKEQAAEDKKVKKELAKEKKNLIKVSKERL